TWSHCSIVISSTETVWSIAAQLTTTSSRPKRRTTASTVLKTASASPTSHRSATASCDASRSRHTSSAACPLTSTQATAQPAAGKDAAATVLADQEKLGHDLFPGVLGRQAMPPGEPADVEQFDTIVEDVGAADPGDLVAHHAAIPDEALLQVQRVGRVIDHVS